jgi:hypothetical protein
MTKKESSLLGLAPLTQSGSNSSVVIYGAAANGSRAPSQAEQRIVVETEKQLQVIHCQRLKAEAAAQEITQMHQQGASEFLEIASHLTAVKETARGKEYQAMVEEYNQRSAQLAAQHLFGVIEVSARNIGMEAARPLYREEEPIVVKAVEKRGFLRRLLGG